ncbi:MAG: universal stress protein [Anaerolineales bacterium]
MNNRETEFLEFNGLKANPRLAGRLPPDLARRYHVLPIAEDGERITVAMANPDDAEAREAVQTTLGKSIYIIRTDVHTIDRLSTELWPEAINHSQYFLTWLPSSSIHAEIKPYAKALSTLMGAHLGHFETSEIGSNAHTALAEETKIAKVDMVIYREPDQPLFRKLFTGSPENKLVDLLSSSLLCARKPRWPLKKILLVIRGEGADETAIDWTLRLAKQSGASVTVLPLIAHFPTIYAHMRPTMPALLTTEDTLGRKLRSVAHRLVDWEIEGTLRIREEMPSQQIRCETIEGNHDLIVIATEPPNRLRRWMVGELVDPLLSWADRPVLIAKSHNDHERQHC